MPFRSSSVVLAAGLLTLGACGEGVGTDGEGAPGVELERPIEVEVEGGAEGEAGAGSESDGESAEGSGSASGTLTLDDGTAFALGFTTCDTSATEPSALPLDNGYDLNGRTSDEAFRLVLIRAGFDEEGAVFSGALEGSFDDAGKNPTLLYVVDETTLALTVDGASVTGTFELSALAPDRPYGNRTGATLDVTC